MGCPSALQRPHCSAKAGRGSCFYSRDINCTALTVALPKPSQGLQTKCSQKTGEEAKLLPACLRREEWAAECAPSLEEEPELTLRAKDNDSVSYRRLYCSRSLRSAAGLRRGLALEMFKYLTCTHSQPPGYPHLHSPHWGCPRPGPCLSHTVSKGQSSLVVDSSKPYQGCPFPPMVHSRKQPRIAGDAAQHRTRSLLKTSLDYFEFFVIVLGVLNHELIYEKVMSRCHIK